MIPARCTQYIHILGTCKEWARWRLQLERETITRYTKYIYILGTWEGWARWRL